MANDVDTVRNVFGEAAFSPNNIYRTHHQAPFRTPMNEI
jgi:hypothetical protein